MRSVSSFPKKKIDAYIAAVQSNWESVSQRKRRDFVRSIDWRSVARSTVSSNQIDTWAFAAFVYEALNERERAEFDEIASIK
jgi:hypothetical protein